MKITTIPFHLILISLSVLTITKAQQPLNFDFERKSLEGAVRPWGWSSHYYWAKAKAHMDSLEVKNGKYALKITNEEDDPYSIAYWIGPRMLRGKTVKIDAWIKVKSPENRAWVSVRTIGDYQTIDSVATRVVVLSGDWTKVTTGIKVDSAAYTLQIEAFTKGKGEVCFDNFSLSVDGLPLTGIPVAPPIGKEEMALLAKHSVPFKGTHASSVEAPGSFEDLAFFGQLVKDAKIIGLGESTHGTSEFFSMKHRLLAFAVYQLGARIFAIEDNQLAAERVNDFVLHGKGTAEMAIQNLFGVWNTREVLDLINWMRLYNEKHPKDKIEFVGYDAQNPTLPIESVQAALDKWDPELKGKITPLYADFYQAWQKAPYPRSEETTMKQWYKQAQNAYKLIAARVGQWTKQATSKEELEDLTWLIQNAKSVANAAMSYTGEAHFRDAFMAENISWILDQKKPAGPMVVWAHDIHINYGNGPDSVYNYFQGKGMGVHLKRKYGSAYKAFGLFTYEGTYAASMSFTNPRQVKAPASPAPEGTIDEALHRLGQKEGETSYILDLSWAQKRPYDHFWIMEPRPVRFATYAASDYGYEMLISLPFQFDGIVFIDKTKAAEKLK